MKRFPEIARRAVSLALAASMSLSVLAPCASAAVTARDLENSVDELGNVDLTDEVFNVPDDTAADADTLGGDDEEEIDLDDLTEEQLAEQAVVDEAGHTEHTPDTDAEPVYEQPATCAERGYAIYPCSFTLEQEDGTVAHCYIRSWYGSLWQTTSGASGRSLTMQTARNTACAPSAMLWNMRTARL